MVGVLGLAVESPVARTVRQRRREKLAFASPFSVLVGAYLAGVSSAWQPSCRAAAANAQSRRAAAVPARPTCRRVEGPRQTCGRQASPMPPARTLLRHDSGGQRRTPIRCSAVPQQTPHFAGLRLRLGSRARPMIWDAAVACIRPGPPYLPSLRLATWRPAAARILRCDEGTAVCAGEGSQR